MLKVNLERELLKQRKAEISATELLQVKEYDRLGDMPDHGAVLDRVGVTGSAIAGKQIVTRTTRMKEQAAAFSQERVFHISQIEALCNKYSLRFLPSSFFKGSVDEKLAPAIVQTEIAYGIKMKAGNEPSHDRSYREPNEHGNTFIVAPESSFALQERPKDPLFFYQINEDYYYLVYKWGNDLSWLRRCIGLLGNPVFTFVAPIIVYVLICSVVYSLLPAKVVWSGIILVGIVGLIFHVVGLCVYGKDWTFISKADFRSGYLK